MRLANAQALTGGTTMDTAHVNAALQSVIEKNKGKIKASIGEAEVFATDENMEKLADLIHPALPFAVRMVIKRPALASLLISQRDNILPLLR